MQGILVLLFSVGAIGDAFTTFSGTLGIMGTQMGNINDIGNYVFATIVTCTITGLNLATIDVFEREEKIIKLFWMLAVTVDFFASLGGGFGFIKPEANQTLAYLLVFLCTIFITASPAMLRYIIKNPID